VEHHHGSHGGNWDLGSNWQGGVVPGAADTAVITGLTSPGTVYLDSGNADAVNSLTTDSTTTLEVITGSLSLGVASSSTLGGTVTVEQGATLNVGAGATVLISVGQTINNSGSLNFATGDAVSFSPGSTIAVNGTMTAKGDSFATNNTSYSTTQIQVNSGGELKAANSTFTLTELSLDNRRRMGR